MDKNWIADAFPMLFPFWIIIMRVSIYIYNFADKKAEQEWVKTQKELLLEGGVVKVITNIKELAVIAKKYKV